MVVGWGLYPGSAPGFWRQRFFFLKKSLLKQRQLAGFSPNHFSPSRFSLSSSSVVSGFKAADNLHESSPSNRFHWFSICLRVPRHRPGVNHLRVSHVGPASTVQNQWRFSITTSGPHHDSLHCSALICISIRSMTVPNRF